MPAKTKSKSQKKPTLPFKAEPVFTWAFKSSQPRMGGHVINYITQLNPDNTLSCNCPGWIFSKVKDSKGKLIPKSCKHTRLVQEEAPNIFKMWKKGDKLPILEETSNASVRASENQVPKPPGSDSKIKYGRFISLD